MMNFRKVLVVGFSLGLTGLTPAAISIQNFSPSANDRFANNPSFVGAGYDWSGVGRAANGTWAVMIAPNVFLSATHYHAGNGTTLSFFPGNNAGATAVTGTIASSQQIGGTDLWLGALSAPLPGGITSYGFMTVPLNEAIFPSSSAANQFVYQSGITPTVGSYGASPLTNQAVGTNRIEGFIDSLVVGGSTGDVTVLVQNLSGDPGFTLTSFEAKLNGGDSGSPLMVVSGGALVVAGIAWAVGTVDIDNGPGVIERDATVYSYTGNHAGVIQDFIAAHPVPEPHSITLIIAAAGMLLIRRRACRSGPVG